MSVREQEIKICLIRVRNLSCLIKVIDPVVPISRVDSADPGGKNGKARPFKNLLKLTYFNDMDRT